MKHILVTGGAGFIGSHVVDKLLSSGTHQVTCIDNFDPFYAPTIKKANLQNAFSSDSFQLLDLDIRDCDALFEHLGDSYDAIIHLAGKAGVRPSIEAPKDYQEVNVIGTQNLLEFAKEKNIKQFIFASSSSVYGVNPDYPWSEDDTNLQPISPYASSKLAAELVGHVYAHLYGIRFIGLRFFTVYGARQRPDLAIHKFCKLIESGEPIEMYGDGSSMRDYTYIDDIVDGVVRALNYTASDFEIINLGNHNAISLKTLIQAIEQALGKKANIKQTAPKAGDVPITYANTERAEKLLTWKALTPIDKGLQHFVQWLRK